MSEPIKTAGLAPETIQHLREAIAHRRSLGLARLDSNEPVDKKIIEEMMEAANWAPSDGDTEPWRFSIFTGDSRIKLGEAFAEAYKRSTAEADFNQKTFDGYKDRALQAPLWVSIGCQPKMEANGDYYMSEEEEVMATACAAQNAHLVAAAHGLIGMWHSKGPSVDPYVAEFVGLKAPARLLGFFFLGWPIVNWPEGERGPIEDKVKYWE